MVHATNKMGCVMFLYEYHVNLYVHIFHIYVQKSYLFWEDDQSPFHFVK